MSQLLSLSLYLSLSHTNIHTYTFLRLYINATIHTDALLPPRTLPKDLKNEELVFLFNNHPISMATEYHHDIRIIEGTDITALQLCMYDNLTYYLTTSDYRNQTEWKRTSEPG